MKEYQARNEGLEFTGIYEWAYERESLKNQAKKIRKEYKTRAILVPDSSNRGLSIYAGPEYFKEKNVRRLKAKIAGFDAKMARLKEDYETKVLELKADHAKDLMRLENESY